MGEEDLRAGSEEGLAKSFDRTFKRGRFCRRIAGLDGMGTEDNRGGVEGRRKGGYSYNDIVAYSLFIFHYILHVFVSVISSSVAHAVVNAGVDTG